MIEKNGKRKPEIDGKHISFLFIVKFFDLLNLLISATVKISLFYFAYLSIDALAGKTTLANIVLSYLTSNESDYGVPWILSSVFFIWAILERKERRRKTEELHKHNRALESRIDNKRTSSGLLPTGETNPEDDKI